MRLRYAFALLLLSFAPASSILAQEAEADTARVYRVEMRDGSLLMGRIVAETETTLDIRMQSGNLVTVARADVRRMDALEQSPGGRVFEPDPNQTRLLFAPTARPVPKGAGYLANYYLFFNFVGYGATDRLTLAGGLSIIPGIGLFNQLFYVAPKLTLYQKGHQAFAVGALAATAALGEQDGVNFAGILFGTFTTGSSRQALTLSLGLPYARVDGDTYLGDAGVAVVGLEGQLGRRTKLISENWIIAARGVNTLESSVLSGALRYYTSRFSLDLGGLVFPGLIDEVAFIPYVDVAYHFGHR